jgi:hypothetical protein
MIRGNIRLAVWTASLAVIAFSVIQCGTQKGRRDTEDKSGNPNAFDAAIKENGDQLVSKGQAVFRYETFGDESFWTDKLQLNKVIADKNHGGLGDGVTPKQALALGFKVDLTILPEALEKKIKEGKFLDDPLVTLELLKLNAVLGVVGKFDGGNLKSIGVTCAVCHSTVDDSTGIGKRMDGWPNRDLNVGKIITLSPNFKAYADIIGQDPEQVKKVLLAWGPGRYDAEYNLDGKGFRPDGKTAATLIPEAFGHSGHNLHTWTGGWGNVTYWNAFVANLQMLGNGTFYDPRLQNAEKYPVAARNNFGNKRSNPDMVTDKLASLQFYQLAIPAPEPPKGSFNEDAAKRGEVLFSGKAKCATCHVPPLFAEPGWQAHKASEICIDDFQASRGPDDSYVTQGLKGLWAHSKRGFYHDGRFATLMDVVNHYNDCKNLGLTDPEKNDLVEYLKSL